MVIKFKPTANTLTILLMLLSFVSAVDAQDISEEITIIGQVLEAEYGENDSLASVVINVIITPQDSAAEESIVNYWVVRDEVGIQMLKLVGETVEATGTVEIDEDGNFNFYVKKYRVIKKE
ncbi:MAG: hypothetical protein SCK70_04055 [bacterium]|nr:hypothetical protein [bacterium]